MLKRLLRVLALACALTPAAQAVLHAQGYERAGEEQQADTLTVTDTRSAADRLKAKVDSLRQALEDSPSRRRQAVSRQMVLADSLHLAYDFASAVDVLRNALAAADSSQAAAVEEALLRGRAALRMTGSVSMPRVKARARLSQGDFRSLFPDVGDWSGRRFYSMSPDGNSLYFSSADNSGAGGYDLFISHRDRASGGWSSPVNLGFPYSSPYNDILYADTPDGKYSVLVSDRDCPTDSLNIYVLAYDPVPPRRAVGDARELRALSGLEPERRRAAAAPARPPRAGVDMSAYTTRTAAVRTLRDSLSNYNRELDALRAGLAEVPEEEQEGYVAAILVKELGLEGLQARLDAATRELQDIELDFLAGGLGQDRPLSQSSDDSDGSSAPQLYLISDDGGSFLGVEESGTISPILPTGAFGEYIVFPAASSFTVRAFVPEDGELPRYAVTAIRLYTGAAPAAILEEGGTAYSAGPFTDRLRAESLGMALRATGVAEVSVTED